MTLRAKPIAMRRYGTILVEDLEIFFDKFLSTPKKYWIRLGFFLGKIISPIIISLIYFVVVFPLIGNRAIHD